MWIRSIFHLGEVNFWMLVIGSSVPEGLKKNYFNEILMYNRALSNNALYSLQENKTRTQNYCQFLKI